jgi:hypothetical protein
MDDGSAALPFLNPTTSLAGSPPRIILNGFGLLWVAEQTPGTELLQHVSFVSPPMLRHASTIVGSISAGR